MQRTLLKTAEETIGRHQMLDKGDRVLVALSGGPDSVCLLHVLGELRSRFSLGLCAAHFNHKLRPSADEDAKFAEGLTTKKGFAFLSSSADVRTFAREQSLSIEDAARRLRYEFLLRAARTMNANKVAVGHNADDQAETILMRLLRGSGPHGLAGIPPVRRLGDAGGPLIIRPLLDAWRSDIMHYVRRHRLRYREDETNESPEYLRNRIRFQLLPRLEQEYNPQIKHRLVGAASALAVENNFMETEGRLLAAEAVIERQPGRLVFNAALLETLHPALRKRVFLALVLRTKPDAPMLEAQHYERADACMQAGRGRLELPGGLRLDISEGAGLISDTARRHPITRKAFDVAIDGATAIEDIDITIRTTVMDRIKSPSRLTRMCTPNRQYFDLDSVRAPIEVRLRRSGDSFRPLGAGGNKKLKDFFIDKKVPRFLRDRVPLLISDGRIMWVMGHAIDHRYRLKPTSGSALRVDYE